MLTKDQGLTAALTTFALLAGTAHAATTIISVQGAAPGVLMVELQTDQRNERGGTATTPDSLDLALAKWRINGMAPQSISRLSVPYDEARSITTASPNLYPVTVRHRIYLKTGQPLRDGQTYAIVTPYGNTSLAFGNRTTLCESIKVNQVGYSQHATSRYANFGAFLGSAGAVLLSTPPAYDVIEQGSGRTVSSGQGAYIKNDTGTALAASGEHVYRLPLNAVPEGGPYYVTVPGCGRSPAFRVGHEATRKIAYVLARGMYHQRCGIALEQPYTAHTRGVCHTKVADTRTPWKADPVLEVPATFPMTPIKGGHHDAGDYDRRPYHTIVPILMLSYYETFPGHFIDRQYNIPESGNGIADFVDEAMWAVLSWEYLQVSNKADPQYGGVRAGTETNRHPAYGVHSAANDTMRYGTWAVSEDVTALSAGIFAQASRIIRPHDAVRADALLGRARAAWGYLTRTTDVNAIKSRLMYASLQLYLATGEEQYHARFKKAAQAIVINGGTWPEQYLPGNKDANAQTVHFVSYLNEKTRPVDAALVAALKQRIIKHADTGTFMGPPPETQPYAQGVTKYMAWGASTAQGRYADVYAFASHFTTDAVKKRTYYNAVSQYADFALGLNPLGRSFVTGLGTHQPQSPTHLDSYYTKYGLSDGVSSEHVGKPKGNVPGIIIYGMTEGRSGIDYQTAVTNKMVPSWNQLPGLRRWTDGWSVIGNNEFTTWETMVWNTAMYGFLYNASQDPNAGQDPGACEGSAPPPQERQLACLLGQTGTVSQRRTAVCTGSNWVYGAWTTTSNTCTSTAPVCRINADGALAVSGLPTTIQCVQRLDTMAQQRVTGGRAYFATPRAAEGTGLYTYRGVNVYGACINKVARLVCTAATAP